MNVKEIERDEELGVTKKDVSISSSFSFETPSRSIRRIGSKTYKEMAVNEIVKRIDEKTPLSLESDSHRFVSDIKSKFMPNSLNLTIFDLAVDRIPTTNHVKLLSHCLYAASEKTFVLPTIKTGMLMDQKKLSERKFKQYFDMMQFIMDETESIGNSKTFIGTVPLIASKFSKPLIDLYHRKGVGAFAIDANFKDVFGNEADFRFILSEINSSSPLDRTFICAFNCGFPRFDKSASRADDFLSLFAYVDVLGGTFKRRQFPFAKRTPKMKIFSRSKYSYDLCSPEDARRRVSGEPSYSAIRDYNQVEQLKESSLVRTLVGREKILPYVQTKSGVDELSIRRLQKIAKSV
jgi:hypothetical protein